MSVGVETLFTSALGLAPPKHLAVDWCAIVSRLRDWALAHQLDLRSAVLLLPFAQHLPLARRAWAQQGGWMPRIETTQTLARALGPPQNWVAGQLSFDASTDRLQADQLLRATAWGLAWWRRDARGFAEAVASVVLTAHALAKAAAAVPPEAREAHWAQAKTLLAPGAGPDVLERLLALVALQWAAMGAAPSTDALFAHQPSAWLVVQAGGLDALTTALLAAAQGPCFVLDCDPPADAATAIGGTLALAECDGFEHEAQCTAAQVLHHLQQGEVPVALVAQDRVLVRRVRALLERAQVPLQDETGWKLSTTRAGAQVMGLLRAASREASTNELIDWLKACAAPWPHLGDVHAAALAVEATCRRRGWRRVAHVAVGGLPAMAQPLWAAATQLLTALNAVPRQPLVAWCATLQTALQACGALLALEADDAGCQVLAALRGGGGVDRALALDEFVGWLDGVLEDAAFRPPAPADAAQVVVAPLAQLMLRPFAAVVLPGADERQLGAAASPHPLLGEAQVAALGLPSMAQRVAAERLAFVHALRLPRVTALYRRMDGAEPRAWSPLIEALRPAWRGEPGGVTPWQDPRTELRLAAQPTLRPLPTAATLLPAQLSASACEALRACPYRFFALHLLKLRDADELDAEIEKRDQGTWLHAVLHAFHTQRTEPRSAADEVASLHAIAQLQQAEQGWAEADYLPIAAGFATLAPVYIAWLHERDAEGAQWQAGEQAQRAEPPELMGMALHGRIDRIDRVAAGAVIELIDYKTGSADALKKQVQEPLEDTQLAFYAALMLAQTDQPLQAQYLVLGGSKGVVSVPHPDVAESAQALITGLGHDFSRIRTGAALPALGEGRVCDFCEARGLCRKDHWT